MKTSHHPADKDARARRALAIEALCVPLWKNKTLTPARLVASPSTLALRDHSVLIVVDPAQPGHKTHQHQTTTVTVVPKTSQDAALALPGASGVLIFGSCAKPGGGWRNGAKAQEEDVSLASSWAVQAEKAPSGFYKVTGGEGVGPDQALFANGVWLTDPLGRPLSEPRPVVFASIAAPNLNNPASAALTQFDRLDRLARRLAGCLLEWQRLQVPTVVLGAIGCGVFGWDGVDSAVALRRAVNHVLSQGPCPAIVLAMPDPVLAATFSRVLSDPPGAHRAHGMVVPKPARTPSRA